jgi:hypothetical protein
VCGRISLPANPACPERRPVHPCTQALCVESQMIEKSFSTWRILGVASAARARRNFAQWREQCVQVLGRISLPRIRHGHILVPKRLVRKSGNPGISNQREDFCRCEGAKCKAKFHAIAGAIRKSMRPDCAPGASGMGTSLYPSALLGIPTLKFWVSRMSGNGLETLSVAGVVRTRQIFTRWREQYRDVRERLA